MTKRTMTCYSVTDNSDRKNQSRREQKGSIIQFQGKKALLWISINHVATFIAYYASADFQSQSILCWVWSTCYTTLHMRKLEGVGVGVEGKMKGGVAWGYTANKEQSWGSNRPVWRHYRCFSTYYVASGCVPSPDKFVISLVPSITVKGRWVIPTL